MSQHFFSPNSFEKRNFLVQFSEVVQKGPVSKIAILFLHDTSKLFGFMILNLSRWLYPSVKEFFKTIH